MKKTTTIADFEKLLGTYFTYKKYTDYDLFIKENGIVYPDFPYHYVQPEGRKIENLTEGEVFDAFFCSIYVLLSSKNDSVPVNIAEPDGDSWYFGWKHNFIVLGSMDGKHITQYNVKGLPESKEMDRLFYSL